MDELNNENESEFPSDIETTQAADNKIFPGFISTRIYSILAERFPRLTQEKDELRVRGMESLLNTGAGNLNFTNYRRYDPDFRHEQLEKYNMRWLEWKKDLEIKNNHFLKLTLLKLLEKTNEVEKEIEMLKSEKINRKTVSKLDEMLNSLYDALIWKRNRLDYHVSSNYVRDLIKKNLR